jgi:uncharacterized protein (DUF1800 family)|tara:strand:+ start:665 stop:2077 length:1413 start_codon:yes stop_codon:yes gene_type:complete
MNKDVSLMAHLMRRAGFGATRSELEGYLEDGYEATVDNLLDPGESGHMPDDIIRRYHVDQSEMRQLDGAGAYWLYRMLTTSNPLEEKLALFWHGLFATGYAKLNQARSLLNQIDMFRHYGFGSYRDLLVELSKDPAMILWLDNNENHKEAINENYGRELLELFSMGIGNYSEDDIKECAKAFTGWTLGNAEYMSVRASKDSIWPYGRIAWHYEYRADDHDGGEKKFLGEVGNFNGADIVDIIVTQEATARFLSTRLFQYFASDEVDSDGELVISEMMEAYFQSGYKVSSVLRSLFNSDYFKSDKCMYSRVKGPVESVVGTVRLAGTYQEPTLDVHSLWRQTLFMGQGLLAPPTVEGWHEGVEWIDSGSLVERINFAAKELGDPTKDGVKDIIRRITSSQKDLSDPEKLVDSCLDYMGPIQVEPETRESLIEFAESQGAVQTQNGQPDESASLQLARLIGMIASTREYQLA